MSYLCFVSLLFVLSLFSVPLLIRIVVVVRFCSIFLICLIYYLDVFSVLLSSMFSFCFAVMFLFGMYHYVEF